MVTGKTTRLNKIARELNVGISTIVDFLDKKGVTIDSNPNTKIDSDAVSLLGKAFSKDSDLKRESEKLNLRSGKKKESIVIQDGLHDLPKVKEAPKKETSPVEAVKEAEVAKPKKDDLFRTPSDIAQENSKIKVVDKIDLSNISGKKSKESTPEAKAKSTSAKPVAQKEDSVKVEVKVKVAAEKSVPTETKTVSEPAVKKDKITDTPKGEDNKSASTPKVVKTAVSESKIETPKKETPKKETPKREAPKTETPKVEATKTEIPKVNKVKTEASKTEVTKTETSKIDAKTSKPEVKAAKPKTESKPKSAANSKPEVKAEGPVIKPVTVEATASTKPEAKDDSGVFKLERAKLSGPKVMGKIELPVEKKIEKGSRHKDKSKRKRKRISNEKVDINSAEVQKEANKKGGPNARKGGPNARKGGVAAKGDANKPRTGGAQGPNKGGTGRPWNKTGGAAGNRTGAAGAGAGKKPIRGRKGKRPERAEVSEVDVQKQVRDTLAQLTSKGKSKGVKHRRDKRAANVERQAQEAAAIEQEKKSIKVTEFVSVNELATMMDVPVNNIIATCMGLGMFVSINQRLDAETMSLVADEFGYDVDFISVEVQEAIADDNDDIEDTESRAPIVTVMGHVDHGKTSLLDYIRKANVIAGEAGGITQHIGAYNVSLDDGKKITFLDTPGHEAFTAMRARGAQVTDIAIIIVAADDSVMPQTVEAINHATAAGVPIIFAINKIDRPSADAEKIKGELANMNYMVEDWGGKYQSQDISAKEGLGIEDLMEKVLLEADMLELKANKEKRATGSIIESTLDKGRGYVSTMLVQNGTLRQGDVILAGQYFGHVKAMFNERNNRVYEVGPSEPVLILGLNGAPQAGDAFNMIENEREARQIANKREQLQREQGLRTQKHITLDEIGRRIAIGNFQELNVIVKGDVDGSIEALSDSLIKLSTDEIAVNVIHKAVGQISESDVMLATASNAIIIGFQVRPSLGARRLAEKEEIDIRLYSIIYDAIDELKSAMEGMLSPEIREEVTATVEVRETFKITKVGTIAGCFVRDGKINRNSKIRLIRDGIVVYSGVLGSLKRFKDDVKEIGRGYECGLNIANYNDIKVDDIIEAYHEVEVKKTL